MDEETIGLPTPDNVIFGEIQVLLAEKRTALASLRTGIAVFALPMSVLSALIATSRYYSLDKVMPLLLPLMLLNVGLVVLGTLCWAYAFTRIYTRPHSRIAATRWIYNNIPPGSARTFEEWDDPLPLNIDDDSEVSFGVDSLVPYQAMLKTAMEQALTEHGTIRAAAQALGMPKSTFADRAREWRLISRVQREKKRR